MNVHKEKIIPQKTKEEIIHYFTTNKENSMRILSKKFGYSVYKIDRVITEYFESIKSRD